MDSIPADQVCWLMSVNIAPKWLVQLPKEEANATRLLRMLPTPKVCIQEQPAAQAGPTSRTTQDRYALLLAEMKLLADVASGTEAMTWFAQQAVATAHNQILSGCALRVPARPPQPQVPLPNTSGTSQAAPTHSAPKAATQVDDDFGDEALHELRSVDGRQLMRAMEGKYQLYDADTVKTKLIFISVVMVDSLHTNGTQRVEVDGGWAWQRHMQALR